GLLGAPAARWLRGHAAGMGRARAGARPGRVHDGGRDGADQPAWRPRRAAARPPPAPAVAFRLPLAPDLGAGVVLTSSSEACSAASRSGAAGASASTGRLTPSPLRLASITPISRSRYWS